MRGKRAALTLAYSPCPNDTYIFAAWTNGLLHDAPPVSVSLLDIDELNAAALRGEPEIVKVSYGVVPHLADRYRVLRAGGALGRGCGPLVVTVPGRYSSPDDLAGARIAIPGEHTTAFLLLRLATAVAFRPVVMRFDRIVPAVAVGAADAGLIIHESRFTYERDGLFAIADLGSWWEETTGMPIPLGAIMVRDDVPEQRLLDETIRRSLRYAREHEEAIMPYVRAHAFEMSDDVMRRHIALYVNDYSADLGDDGAAAIRELFERAHAARLFGEPTRVRFVE
jgi:1,4-dihydroxy-6-naphthoate synthase